MTILIRLIFASILFFFKVKSQFCEPVRQNLPSTISIQNCKTTYQLLIDIGTPPNAYSFLIDTGSDRTWLPTASCQCGPGIDPSASTTSNMTNIAYSIQYYDQDKVSGFQGTETFSFTNTSFIGITYDLIYITKKEAPLTKAIGIFALGYPSDNIFDKAFKQGRISSDTFILKLSDKDYESFIYYDQLPQNIISKNAYSPLLLSAKYWTIRFYGLQIEGEDFSVYAETKAVVDSGTTMTEFNPELYEAIIKRFFKDCNNTATRGLLCPFEIFLPTIKFYLEGSIVKLEPKYYSSQRDFKIQVYLKSSDTIILGMSFFRNYAVTFSKSQSRIGFHGDYELLTSIYSSSFYGYTIGIVTLLAFILLVLIILKFKMVYQKHASTSKKQIIITSQISVY